MPPTLSTLRTGDRLDRRLPAGQPPGQATLAAFAMAGAPDQREVRTLLEALGRHAGVLEVGLPYSDPWLDGPVVAEAGAEALRAGFRTADLFPLVEMLRVRTPAAITVMSYWNPVRAFGPPDFARRLAEAGGSAVLLPDLPVEEAEPWLDAAHQYGIRTSFLVSPDCSPRRLALVAAAADGFLYLPAARAVSGHRGGLDVPIGEAVRRLRQACGLPVAAGIGITCPQQAVALARTVDCVVVGSAFLRLTQADPGPGGIRAAEALAAGFARALRPQRPTGDPGADPVPFPPA
ncbi:tryptophan synthase subunit alpha [Kitasatospora purpeofusca]|uniref:tryptophan synthase subunit alpha n=1 Tax=Kitasatospora purpeofusca TaxID=67352 RepID=UPI002E134D40|nr:tryptophan synthase subunit alpha [Kitasatospora purpeofusca]WSR29674.1 tryptophan synthase subunit alpha [Kitasatospora purpeofusca]